MLIDQLPEITTANDADEMPIEQGTTTRKIKILNLLKGVVKKAGDTMTGTLTINNANPCIWLKDNNDIDMTPSSAVNSNNIYWKDKNGKQYGLVRSRHFTNGRYGMWFAATRKDGSVANGIELYYDQNDNPTVILAYPAAWREALGLGTSGALPITVTQGGTGSTGVASTGTLAQIATVATGFTFSAPYFAQWGKVGLFRVGITKNVAWSGNQTPGTVVNGKRTITQCALVCYTNPNITGFLDPIGTITINSPTTINANVTHYFYAIYLLA